MPTRHAQIGAKAHPRLCSSITAVTHTTAGSSKWWVERLKAGTNAMRRPNSPKTAAKAKPEVKEYKPKRSRLTHEARKEAILQEAISYFSEVGFDGGTRELAL